MMQARYIENLIQRCGGDERKFVADAVEWAIIDGWIHPTYENIEADVKLVMDNYDSICERFQNVCRENERVLQESYEDSGLMEEILRPVPLSK